MWPDLLDRGLGRAGGAKTKTKKSAPRKVIFILSPDRAGGPPVVRSDLVTMGGGGTMLLWLHESLRPTWGLAYNKIVDALGRQSGDILDGLRDGARGLRRLVWGTPAGIAPTRFPRRTLRNAGRRGESFDAIQLTKTGGAVSGA